MKREFNFYKSWYSNFSIKNLLPVFGFTKNIQGYSFIRVWSLNWFTYTISYRLIKRSDLDEDRNIAHKKNVDKYMIR